MEELKELVGIIAQLPGYTIGILAGYMFYKLVIVGSIFGVIKLLIVKIHDWLVTPKTVIHKFDMMGHVMGTGTHTRIQTEIIRLLKRPGHKGHSSQYLWEEDVRRLAEAIDRQLQAEAFEAKEKAK